MSDVIYLGEWRNIRNGGHYASAGNFSKINIKQGEIEAWQGYLELLMKEEEKKRWNWFLESTNGKVNYKNGTTSTGINYVALEITLHKFLPITLFLYTTSDGYLSLYWPGRGNTSVTDRPFPETYDIELNDPLSTNILKYGTGTVSIEGEVTESASKASIYKREVNQLLARDLTFTDPRFKELCKREPYLAFSSGAIMFGPGEIRIKDPIPIFNYDFVVKANMDMMIEDFEHCVWPAPATEEIIEDSEILLLDQTVADEVDELFGWKNKGVESGIDHDYYQVLRFDPGTLEDIETDEVFVYSISEWENLLDTRLVDDIKKLYPKIKPSKVYVAVDNSFNS